MLLGPRLVATVEHVVDGASSISLIRNGKVLALGTVIGSDSTRDVALVRTNSPIGGYEFKLSGSPPLLGEDVAAIGFPFDLPLTVTRGSVSGLDRTIPINGIDRTNLIQTDAPVNPGNSGGPLIDDNGTVVGLVDLGTNQANGLAFAVSAVTAGRLIDAWLSAPQPQPLASCGQFPPATTSLPATPPPASTTTPAATTVPAATTTPQTSEPGGAIAAVSLSQPGEEAMGIVQSYASDLAHHDWSAARGIDPALPSDAQLAAGYADLQASTVVITAEGASAANVVLMGAYVAWETFDGVNRSSIYCGQWTVNVPAGELVDVKSVGSDLVGYTAGWANPASLVPVVVAQC
ncbi:MAG TPA: S1C family serine protease [Acidimicrobiales bacterium]|nr:S1C family serine protease [Acidimicrobiales bacterium]